MTPHQIAQQFPQWVLEAYLAANGEILNITPSSKENTRSGNDESEREMCPG